jgi:phosphatidylserine decarboxylase
VGLIKFGSRVDVVLPAEAVLQVKVGDRVKGGESVLAAMGEAQVAFVTQAAERALGARVSPEPTFGETE